MGFLTPLVGVHTGAWGDQIDIGGFMTLYDDLGNPTVYRGMGLTWGKGRQLVGAQSINFSASYTYNADGIRIGKSVTASHPLAGTLTTEHHYVLDGTRILAEIFNSGVMVFLYADESALTPRGIKYHRLSDDEGEWHYYYYDTDNFGNIVGIYCAASGRKIVTYQYDAWGNCTQIQESPYYLYDHSVMANNPFRYRGYYYDTETGLYYLQRRYYDPNTGRFLNADNAAVISATPDQLTDKNLYAYCDNNPVMRTDDGGEFWHVAIAAAVGLAFELGTQLYESGGDWSQINVAKLGIATATAAISSACGPAIGAVISGAGEVLMELSDGTSDPKQLLSSFFTGTASSLVGSGVGEIARKVGGKIAVNVLSKKSPGEIKGVILSVIDVAGRDRNAVKNISWTLQQPQYKHLPSALLGENIPEFFSSVAGGIFDLLGGN